MFEKKRVTDVGYEPNAFSQLGGVAPCCLWKAEAMADLMVEEVAQFQWRGSASL